MWIGCCEMVSVALNKGAASFDMLKAQEAGGDLLTLQENLK
jgi:hypothetical protein